MQPESLFWRLYADDAFHPSLLGSYLAACVFFAVVTGKSPVGSPYVPSAEALPRTAGATTITAAEATRLQEVAWAAVKAEATEARPAGEPSFLQVEPDRYQALLSDRVGAAQALLRDDNLLPDALACEVHASRPCYFRQRIGLGVYDAARPGEYRLSLPPDRHGHELSYVYWDSGEMVRVDRHQCLLASETINAAMPHLLDYVEGCPALRDGLRSAKFLTNLRGTDLICSLIYGGSRSQPLGGSWEDAAAALQAHLHDRGAPLLSAETCHVSILGRARKTLAVVGKAFVLEDGFRLESGFSPRYRQPEQAFSNPNGQMGLHTLNWLASCAAEVRVACGSALRSPDGLAGKGAPLDLLELYCGNGNHTVALSRSFDRTLAVEINARLVAACKENLALNRIANVEVRCVDAGKFCRSIIQSRRWVSRPQRKQEQRRRSGPRTSKGAPGTANGAPATRELQSRPGKKGQEEQNAGQDATTYDFRVVLVDPPRGGLDATTLEAVAKFDHVMYVSCNPFSLRRDLLALRDAAAALGQAPLAVRRYAFFDHFPYTKHVEVGVLLSRDPPRHLPAAETVPASHRVEPSRRPEGGESRDGVVRSVV